MLVDSPSSPQLHPPLSKGTSPFSCRWENCEEQFKTLQQLVAHLEHQHTMSLLSYVCMWEGCTRQRKPFDARYKLVTHLRCHTGERPFKCGHPGCGRRFSRLENLKLHTRTHTGEKPYTCHHKGCEKRFNNTSDRAKHMKTHITRKPYVCKHEGCGKAYTDPSSMRKHVKLAHKEKKLCIQASHCEREDEMSATAKVAESPSLQNEKITMSSDTERNTVIVEQENINKVSSVPVVNSQHQLSPIQYIIMPLIGGVPPRSAATPIGHVPTTTEQPIIMIPPMASAGVESNSLVPSSIATLMMGQQPSRLVGMVTTPPNLITTPINHSASTFPVTSNPFLLPVCPAGSTSNARVSSSQGLLHQQLLLTRPTIQPVIIPVLQANSPAATANTF